LSTYQQQLLQVSQQVNWEKRKINHCSITKITGTKNKLFPASDWAVGSNSKNATRLMSPLGQEQ
jgi:hypothetical protein